MISEMKKLYPLLSVLFLIYWGCLDPLNIFDSNDEETVNTETETGPSVNLWGVDYSIENTTELDLGYNQLTGSIPSKIGNLTNLTGLNLSYNQLTGEIPESICNLVDNNCYIHIYYNQLCPPYPSCIGNSVEVQDTTNCN